MKRIPLTQGKFAIVDDGDYERLGAHKWCAVKDHGTYYAVRTGPQNGGTHVQIRMHREILGLQRGDKRQVDHINHNGLDNRRENIRIVNCAENQWNTSRKGYCWHKQLRKWVAKIKVHGRVTHLGLYDDPSEAHAAYLLAKTHCHQIGT